MPPIGAERDTIALRNRHKEKLLEDTPAGRKILTPELKRGNTYAFT